MTCIDESILRRLLSPRELRCMGLYYYDGLSQRRIGLGLELHQGTVSRVLRRGMAKLRRAGLDPHARSGQATQRPESMNPVTLEAAKIVGWW